MHVKVSVARRLILYDTSPAARGSGTWQTAGYSPPTVESAADAMITRDHGWDNEATLFDTGLVEALWMFNRQDHHAGCCSIKLERQTDT